MQKGYNKAYKLFFNLEYLTAAALSEANFGIIGSGQNPSSLLGTVDPPSLLAKD